MSFNPASTEHHAGEPSRGPLAWWHDTPLYLRILGGLLLGLGVGLALGPRAEVLEIPAKLILRLLGALAPPLILFAVVHALMTTDLRGRIAGRLFFLLILNTVVAIVIGLAVANVVQPGRHARLEKPPTKDQPLKGSTGEEQQVLDTLHKYGYKPASETRKTDAASQVVQFLENIPDTLLRPFTENNKTIGVIFVAVAFGFALRGYRRRRIETVQDVVELGFETLLKLLHWVIQVVPLGVFGIVASIVGKQGFDPFKALAFFILAVILALLLQASYYLIRVRLGTWVRPGRLIAGVRDALVMAFSTASSTATMPVTYACLRDRVGVRESSASLGALVGANFNNDGTALYEAMAALFMAQMLGIPLSLEQQVLVVLTSVLASVGAAGIPEAGLVTMMLVFKSVNLPIEYIPLLLPVDWFLDRCRTAINVMGDCNVSCMLDGQVRKSAEEALAEEQALESADAPQAEPSGA